MAIETICIDFGHGGKDIGAVNTKYRINEANVVLSLKDSLIERAKNAGIRLFFTRTDDTFVTLSERAKQANIRNVDLFYSIHCNAFNGIANGIECFYYKYSKRSEDAAEIAQSQLMKHFPTHKDRGVKKANFAVLRKTNMRAVLWELEFIDTDLGAETLTNNKALDRYADAIINSALLTLDVPDNKRSKTKQVIGEVTACLCKCNH